MQEVNSDESKISISGRKVVLVIAKAGSTEEYWPRLLHSKQKQNNITVRSLSRCPVTPHVGALPLNGKLTKLDGVFAQQHRVEYALGHQAREETPHRAYAKILSRLPRPCQRAGRQGQGDVCNGGDLAAQPQAGRCQMNILREVADVQGTTVCAGGLGQVGG